MPFKDRVPEAWRARREGIPSGKQSVLNRCQGKMVVAQLRAAEDAMAVVGETVGVVQTRVTHLVGKALANVRPENFRLKVGRVGRHLNRAPLGPPERQDRRDLRGHRVKRDLQGLRVSRVLCVSRAPCSSPARGDRISPGLRAIPVRRVHPDHPDHLAPRGHRGRRSFRGMRVLRLPPARPLRRSRLRFEPSVVVCRRRPLNSRRFGTTRWHGCYTSNIRATLDKRCESI